MRGAAIALAALAGASCTTAAGDRIGAEIQAYPAGVIPGLHARHLVNDGADAITLRIAANITERGDFGEHEDESGSGFGLGAGWRHAVNGTLETDGWLYGARLDVWSLDIDWEDPGPRTGSTDILVVQPTVEVGYGWSFADGGRLELTAGLGAEINVDTDGEDVGEGAIGLIGLTWLP